MTEVEQPGVLGWAQRVVQTSRVIPELAHRTFGRFSEVGTEPFLDPGDFPWTALLEEYYPAIRTEAERVLRVRDALPNFQDIAPDKINLSDDDLWKTFWFVGYDVWDDPNCLRCPATAAVLRAIPGLTTGFLSILGPGKRLPPHYGPYRGVLRHHLALIVPEPREQCGIRVGGQVRHWAEGTSLVFDDTYEHEAWNDSDTDRVVLFLDIKRPLRPPVNWVNDGIIKAVSKSPFIKAARAQHVAREERFTAAWNAVVGAPGSQARSHFTLVRSCPAPLCCAEAGLGATLPFPAHDPQPGRSAPLSASCTDRPDGDRSGY